MSRNQRFSKLRSSSVLVLMILLVQFLVACGGGSSTSDTPPNSQDAAKTTATTSDGTQNAEGEGTQPGSDSQQPQSSPQGGQDQSPQQMYGANVQLFWTDRARVLQLANNAGLGWVRQQIHWKDLEGPKGNFGWQELDNIVNATEEAGIKLLVNITRSPAFARADGGDGLPDNPKDLGDFVEALATRYKGKIDAYEIWNEQNLAHENAGRIVPEDAGHYVELLVEAYKRIKAVDPNAIILAGACSSSGVNDPNSAVADIDYYKAMYTYKDGIIKDYFDAQAVHPGGAANPPDTLYPDNPSNAPGWNDHPTHYFRHVENVRKVMEEHGFGDRPVWITEFGWATQNDTPGYEFGNEITLEEQADYIEGALRRALNHYPWVKAMFVWNLNFSVVWGEQNRPLHEQASFSIINPDWSPRPSFTKIQGFIHAVRQQEGAGN